MNNFLEQTLYIITTILLPSFTNMDGPDFKHSCTEACKEIEIANFENQTDTIPSRKFIKEFISQNIDSIRSLLKHEYSFQDERGDSVLSLTYKKTGIQEILIFCDPKSSKIIKAIDLWSLNPYITPFQNKNPEYIEQQISGYNMLVQGRKSSIFIDLPPLLIRNIPDEWMISSIQNTTYVSSNRSGHIVVKFDLIALPQEEILEKVTYPGITSFLIIDSTGQIVNKIKDLPYVVTSWAIDQTGKYLVITHLADILKDQSIFSDNGWIKYLKVLDVESGKICLSTKGKDECECAYYKVPKHIIFACYDHFSTKSIPKPNIRFYLIHGALYTRDIDSADIFSFTRSPDYEWVRKKDGSEVKYYYNKDYKNVPLNCE